MSALTGQEIVSSLSTLLRSRFSKTEFAEIYKDKPVQSMKTPCIFIHSIETALIPDRGNYGWWDHLIDIRCHPGVMQTNVHTWARALGPMIAECANAVTINGQSVRSRETTWKVEDNVLHVIVKYKYRVMQIVDEAPDMQTLAYGQRIK